LHILSLKRLYREVIPEMPDEYEYKELRTRQEKLESEMKEIENRLKELRARSEEREAKYEEKEKLIGRFWRERAVYISIIIGSISILLTIILIT